MKFLINNWYRLGAVLGLILVTFLAFHLITLSAVQILLIWNLIALFAHQFEEYQFPGGAPIIINKVVYDETTLADHYPGNGLSIMLVNTIAWVIYLVAILLPNYYWLGLGVIFFSLFQILGHCIQMPLKLRAWYNPGMVTTVGLFLPLGVIYINKLSSLGKLNWGTIFLAFLVLIVCILFSIVAPVQLLKNKHTKYPINHWQIKRYNEIMDFCQLTRSK